MRISITVVASDTNVTNDFIPLEVFPDMSLDDVKGFVEAEINIPPEAQTYIINDQIIRETSSKLTDLGINDGDILSLAIQTRPQTAQRNAPTDPAQQRSTQRQRNGPDPETLRLQLLGDPRQLAEIRAQNPDLANAVNDAARFSQVLDDMFRQRAVAQREREEMMARLDADPFNIEAQEKIEEMIRQDRVLENMQKAYEENPESFGGVTMLYIDVLVNNIPIKAFVDSGAQSTIMSPDAAERCGILRLIDRRFAGMARGVGTAKILGRVHSAEIQIGQYSLASSFTVMEGKDVDLLLGLDMLKRHQMCIDLKENCLRVASDRVQFLPESEIPKMMDHIQENEPKVQGPGGATIGATTGTIEPASSSKSGTSASASNPAPAATTPSSTSSSRITIHPPGSTGNIIDRPSNPTPISAQRPPQASNPAPTNSPFGAPAPITEQSIAQVMELGFSREEAVGALQSVGGNVELAIGLLL